MGSVRRHRAVRLLAGVVLVAVALGGMLTYSGAQAATGALLQGRAKEITSGATNSLAFGNPNTAGNLIVVYAIWGNTGSATISDSNGNAYAPVAPAQPWGNGNGWRSQVFYAKNIAGGANTVTATFGSSITSFGAIYIHEYSGLDRTNPLDTTAAATGSPAAMNSGSATTTNAADLIFGAGASSNTVTAAGSGFTTRLSDFGNRTEDKNVSSTGSYNATATQNGNRWVMHMVAFRTATGPPDTSPPSATVTAPQAGAVVSGSVNVTATATDDVGVAGVQFLLDGQPLGSEDTTAPYGISWDTTT